MLPNGSVHLVFRLGTPLRLFAHPEDHEGELIGRAVLGGARAHGYLRALDPTASVGATLRPGATRALFGVEAADLAHRHTSVAELAPRWSAEVEERLLSCTSLADRLDLFEALLLRRLRDPVLPHPAVRPAMRWLADGEPVARVVERTGYSHRHFIAAFRREVGLTPKVWARIQRLGRALQLAASHPDRGWSELALLAGYADQAHLHRELVALGGLTPAAWRAAAPRALLHVPMPSPRGVSSVQDARRTRT